MKALYASTAYAGALGEALEVENWDTAVVVRAIAHSEHRDAAGCYPLARIAKDANLQAGLEELRRAGLVSLAMVPDPVTAPGPEALAAAFDVCTPFKQHYVIDRSAPVRFAKAHRYYARRGQASCDIRPVRLADHLNEWRALYGALKLRKGLAGVHAFSDGYFELLARAPQVRTLAAFAEGRPAAMALWVVERDVAYYHLAASSDDGYRLNAMHGLMASAVAAFAEAPILHLGGGAGLERDASDGLAHFKRGFANRTQTAYFCGSRLNPDIYDRLSTSVVPSSHFPAYRGT